MFIAMSPVEIRATKKGPPRKRSWNASGAGPFRYLPTGGRPLQIPDLTDLQVVGGGLAVASDNIIANSGLMYNTENLAGRRFFGTSDAPEGDRRFLRSGRLSGTGGNQIVGDGRTETACTVIERPTLRPAKCRMLWRSLKLTSTPGGTRTPNPRFRRPMLYPIELRTQVFGKIVLYVAVYGGQPRCVDSDCARFEDHFSMKPCGRPAMR